jgi:tRNA threonylcarbamoyladenosine biosynthesis protein TsaB
MPSMPRILALDTATQACSLALVSGGSLVRRHKMLARAHNRHILQMLSEILQGRALVDAVDVIACGVGPGSFTGLRVAVSVAQGLAWSQRLPVHAFCSLEAQIYAAAEQNLLSEGDCVLSTIDAQINQLYGLWGIWTGHQVVTTVPPFISAPDQIPVPDNTDKAVILGSGIHYQKQFTDARLKAAPHYDTITPDAGVMASLLAGGALPLDLQPAHLLTPQYVQRDIGWKKLSEQGRRD